MPSVQIAGLPAFNVPQDEVGRNMLDDDRLRDAVSTFNFADEAVVVIGGGGYVGLHIAQLLLMSGTPPREVRLFDVVAPPAHLMPTPAGGRDGRTKVTVQVGDIASAADVDAALRGATCVMHVASYGMSGKEMLNVRRIRQVNLVGTTHLLAAAQAHHVRAYIYTSSYNAVFCGKPFRDALELPYPDSLEFCDEYSRTKSIADRQVLEANGRGELRTVSLRMAGIYGVGERRHFPRIIRLVKLGAVQMTIGGLEARQEWVSIANAAYAHVLAAARLLDCPSRDQIAGRAFPISDQCPVNQYRMLEPLFLALGNPLPRVDLSVRIALWIAHCLEFCLWVLSPIVALEPILTRGEIHKVAVEHYFSPDSATKGLGYKPIVPFTEGIARTIAAFAAEVERQVCVKSPSDFRFRAFVCCLLLTVVYVVAFHVATVAAPATVSL